MPSTPHQLSTRVPFLAALALTLFLDGAAPQNYISAKCRTAYADWHRILIRPGKIGPGSSLGHVTRTRAFNFRALKNRTETEGDGNYTVVSAAPAVVRLRLQRCSCGGACTSVYPCANVEVTIHDGDTGAALFPVRVRLFRFEPESPTECSIPLPRCDKNTTKNFFAVKTALEEYRQKEGDFHCFYQPNYVTGDEVNPDPLHAILEGNHSQLVVVVCLTLPWVVVIASILGVSLTAYYTDCYSSSCFCLKSRRPQNGNYRRPPNLVGLSQPGKKKPTRTLPLSSDCNSPSVSLGTSVSCLRNGDPPGRALSADPPPIGKRPKTKQKAPDDDVDVVTVHVLKS